MSQTGVSNRRVTWKMGVHHSVIDRLMQRVQATRMVDERPQYGRQNYT